MSHTPTAEQAAVIDAFTSEARPTIVVQAGAGCGKSSTLKMAANAQPRRRGLYVAYNRALATEAKRDFPASVDCRTAHSLAFGPVGRHFSARLSGPRVPAKTAAEVLGFNNPVQIADALAPLSPVKLARLVMAMVGMFLNSADNEPGVQHLVPVDGYSDTDNAELAKYLVPFARKAWDDLQLVRGGRLQFTHDTYLKIYQLSRPRIPVDFVLLDEAQDLSPVMASLFHFQDHAQRIMVGDSAQAIYGFRGAIDAMRKFVADQRLTLSQSFRFGPAIAGEANRWLDLLRAPLRLRGFEPAGSTIGMLDRPDAVLCRSNAGAIGQLVAAVSAGRRAALVGGGTELVRLAEAAMDLMSGKGTAHPELIAFSTWDQVEEHAALDDASGSLKVLVKLINEHTPERILAIVSSLVDEKQADVIISTAHKAKGREWDQVRIAPDFREPRVDPLTGRPLWRKDELMLAYVAVTRARKVLDRGGLAWLDDFDRGVPGPSSWLATAVREHPDAILDDLPNPYDPNTQDDEDGVPGPCQPIGCDNGFHLPRCFYAGESLLDPAEALRIGRAAAGIALETPVPAPRRSCPDCQHTTIAHRPAGRGVRCSACGCTTPQLAGAVA
ncbi:DNA helicase [Actinoplanes italicus]|uniref:UvrD-like helicase family protein n=1 Tax=Actinoplanes italicus TaxID=113567 RepID=A0A2T0KJ06_9ACTN|nr:UvrD-helicase domain-containing protein [Actinoplanes italicus]PRX23505.1 UvrD-like helicase family protein [Actinoplanes italicus]GIE30001.1 DNA helicase [Actinoplanes italicus]